MGCPGEGVRPPLNDLFPAEVIVAAVRTGHEPQPEPDALQALLARRAARNDYLVICKPGISDPYQVLSRHRIDPVDLYRFGSWGFAAPLTGYQLERAAAAGGPALPEGPDVARIELDHDRLAPHFRTPPERRVNGEYLVSVRGSGDPRTVAARAGVSSHRVFDSINGFGGGMTDAQIQALPRSVNPSRSSRLKHARSLLFGRETSKSPDVRPSGG